MILRVVVDEATITSDNGVLKLKLSTDADQGLSFDSSGNLIATPGSSSGTGVYNISGNAIGPTSAQPTTPLNIVGMNSTVSRHQKYPGQSTFIRENDGVVMSKITGGAIDQHCIAYYMTTYNNGGGE